MNHLEGYDSIALAILVALGIYLDHRPKREKYPNAIDVESEVVPPVMRALPLVTYEQGYRR